MCFYCFIVTKFSVCDVEKKFTLIWSKIWSRLTEDLRRLCSDVTCLEWCDVLMHPGCQQTSSKMFRLPLSLLRQKLSGPDGYQSTWVAQLPADRTSLPPTSSGEHNYKIQFRDVFLRAWRDASASVVTTWPAPDLAQVAFSRLQLLWGFYRFFCVSTRLHGTS